MDPHTVKVLPQRKLGEIVYLRPLTADDLPATRQWRNQTRQWFKNPATITPEQHQQWYVDYCRRSEDAVFVVIETASELPVGQVSVYDIDWQQRQAEVGRFVISPDHARRGFMKAACRLLIDHCFNRLDLTRLYLSVLEHNVPAISLYTQLGFKPYGTGSNIIDMHLLKQTPRASHHED